MHIIRKTILILLFSATLFYAYSQTEKSFKTGLVLSGGGAKGLAHIGLLQLVDSLEIQVDYMTGTSMGAILAGMYSVGYSADSITEIINNIEWRYVLSNKMPLTRIHINEKEHYDAELIRLPIKKYRPSLPGFFVEGQYLSETLGKYLFPARNINDFHKLPIPLEIISADIISGKKVVMKNGSLPIAIRASMAIPAVFSPIAYEDKLLVDGGLLRNFPVEEIRAMGAQVVIGSYTGFRVMESSEIDNAFNTLYQSFALKAVDDAKQMMAQTDILLDLTEALKIYGTQSFSEFKEIIEAGRKEANKLLPQLLMLKKKQLEAGIEYQRKKVKTERIPIQTIRTLTPDNKPMPEKERKYILAELDTTNMDNLDSEKYLSEKIKTLYSYLNYSKVYATFSFNKGTKELNLFFKETKPTIELSIHYDTYESAGIAIRYNHNNLFFNNSKFSAAIDLSQYYKSNIYYQKFLNARRSLWTKLEFDTHRQRSNDILFRLPAQLNHYTDPTLHNTFQKLAWTIGTSPSISTSLTTGLELKFNQFTKEVGNYSRFFNWILNDTVKIQSLYKHSHLDAFIRFNQNTQNKSLFPTRGNKLETGVHFFFNNRLTLNAPNPEDKIATEYYKILEPHSADLNHIASSNPIVQIWANEYATFPLTRKTSLHWRSFIGFNINMNNNALSDSYGYKYTFLSQKFNLGGYSNYQFYKQFPFPGFSINESKSNSLLATTFTIQWNAWKNFYLSPTAGLSSNVIGLVGYGLDLDYITPIGPAKLSVSSSWPMMKPNIFFSLGYQF